LYLALQFVSGSAICIWLCNLYLALQFVSGSAILNLNLQSAV